MRRPFEFHLQWLAPEAVRMQQTPLGALLQDPVRTKAFAVQAAGIQLDFTRQKLTQPILDKLIAMAFALRVPHKIRALLNGNPVNTTQGQPVTHVHMRTKPPYPHSLATSQARTVITQAPQIYQRISTTAQTLRTNGLISTCIVIGIGGSSLGTEFLYQALLPTEPQIELRFLTSLDPTDFFAATRKLIPAKTIAIVISKTFTTDETLTNARNILTWFSKTLDPTDILQRLYAVTAEPSLAETFGVATENIFHIWHSIGGRYSVSSATGMLPIALAFGYDTADQFLQGARDMDTHFASAAPRHNLPYLLALLSVWNTSFLQLSTHALIPYHKPLHRFPAYAQQLLMESNGKSVARNNVSTPYPTGAIYFGEPGPEAQHSFFQLLQQGRIVPAEFILYSTTTFTIPENPEQYTKLVANLFAQANTLACGNWDENPRPETLCPGNRPVTIVQLYCNTPKNLGALVALYEHRTVVEGFLWDINSFDQFGVDAAKNAAKNLLPFLLPTHSP